MLGFAVVLAISAASMGIAYLGFERVSAGVASYRNSVSEADLARNIDRELISYRALARYYVVTGKEDDAKAIRVIMEHTSKNGEPRILKACTYPLTAAGCVKRIYTNLAVIDVTPQGLFVIEMIPGLTLEKLQTLTEPKLQLASHWQALAPPVAPEARAA